MITKRFFARLRKRLRDFCVARSANVTVTFALSTIPVIGAVGAAVDYSHANSARTAMQAAVDATALKLSKEASTLTAAQINTKAVAYFTALYSRAEVTNISVIPTYTSGTGEQIVVQASGTLKASFASLIGVSQINVGASSTVKWGNLRIRVALVLDNTGSMADYDKIGALKTATKNLLTQLKNAAVSNGDVYVSIIPFVKDVNVGPNNYNAGWIDWTQWDKLNGTCSNKNFETYDDCVSKNKNWTPNSHDTWNGCVSDRGGAAAPSVLNTDTNVTPPLPLVTDTQFPAEQYGSCPQAVMPLNYDWSAMNNLVDLMSPAGNTNQGIGLAHGWMSLVGGGPYPQPPAMDPKYKYQQIIILLTDGLNTQNRWYNSASSIDARQKMTCDNVKNAGITLYTVQVNTDGDPTSTLLQGCASDASKFFLLTSASQMVTTFNRIGTDLANLRVAK